MEIAPGFTSIQWRQLQLDTDLDDWSKAIEVLENRLKSRFFNPIDVLRKAEADQAASENRFGFTILAIDMLLIETLQSFKEGIISTAGKSKNVFTSFLETSVHFNEFFPTQIEREKFYGEFRCGILHQSEVQGIGLVWTVGALYERVDDMETLNRNEFHEALIREFRDYTNRLRDVTELELRKNFRTKMDAIAGLSLHSK